MPAPKVRTKGPAKLKPRHFTMASYVAADWTDQEIGKALGCSFLTVRATRASPLFQLEVKRLKREQASKISNNYVDHVMKDGLDNVAFLKKVRDGKLPDFEDMSPGERIKARMSAALPLFDRQMPKRSEDDSPPTINIVFQQNEQRLMAEACRDIGVRIPQLDTVIAEFEKAETDAATRTDA